MKGTTNPGSVFGAFFTSLNHVYNGEIDVELRTSYPNKAYWTNQQYLPATSTNPESQSSSYLSGGTIADASHCQLNTVGNALASVRPSTWTSCNDKAFSFKLDSFFPQSNMVVEVKHQYRGNGQRCVMSNGAQCTTSRTYHNIGAETMTTDSTAELFGETMTWAGPYNATIFSTCGSGCGLTSGNN
ncbi:hypothetical protein MBLNU459_g0724t1 [Dothideomycetes sp. NU459]